MSLLFICHFAVTWALVGLIWTVQLVHYPLFAQVGSESFRRFHQRHTTQITWIVAPLMFIELSTMVWLLTNGASGWWLVGSLVPLAGNWLSTWRIQVPIHTKLEAGFDVGVHQRLVATNWFRTVAWTSRGLLLLIDAQG